MLRDEEWNDNEKWIGCSGIENSKTNCDSWFHKSCLSEEVSNMDADQVQSYELLCETCLALSKSKRSKINSPSAKNKQS